MLISRIRKTDHKEQSLSIHCHNVSHLCAIYAQSLGLPATGELLGLLHDFGKATSVFSKYMREENIKKQNHAFMGLWYVYRHWYPKGNQEHSASAEIKKETAQILALCIYGHHAGLPDCLGPDKESFVYECRRAKWFFFQDEEMLNWWQGQSTLTENQRLYLEAERNFHEQIISEEDLNKLFAKACQELKNLNLPQDSFTHGMIVRFLFSILVDADCWDAECFSNSRDPMENVFRTTPDWKNFFEILQKYSKLSWENVNRESEIYTLVIPESLERARASMHFAFTYAVEHQKKHIFYITTSNLALERKAKEISKCMENALEILIDRSYENPEPKEESNSKLTERWADNPVIMATLSELLNDLFKKGSSRTRKIHHLMDSFVILDDVKDVPDQYLELLEKTLYFLAKHCHCSILLTTGIAYGNRLLEKEKCISVTEKTAQKLPLCKVNWNLDSYENAAEEVLTLLREETSVICLLNRQDSVRQLSRILSDRIKKEKTIYKDIKCIQIPYNRSLNQCDEKMILQLKNDVKEKTVCCIATSFAEFEGEVFFPAVIQSMTGLQRIAGAVACLSKKQPGDSPNKMFLWNLGVDEATDYIEKNETIITKMLLKRLKGIEKNEINLEEEQLFSCYWLERKTRLDIEDTNNTLKLLSGKMEYAKDAQRLKIHPEQYLCKELQQSFRTVGNNFQK